MSVAKPLVCGGVSEVFASDFGPYGLHRKFLHRILGLLVCNGTFVLDVLNLLATVETA
jgi:hypothetical protein